MPISPPQLFYKVTQTPKVPTPKLDEQKKTVLPPAAGPTNVIIAPMLPGAVRVEEQAGVAKAVKVEDGLNGTATGAGAMPRTPTIDVPEDQGAGTKRLREGDEGGREEQARKRQAVEEDAT